MDIFTTIVMVVISLIFIVGIIDMVAFQVACRREEAAIRAKQAEIKAEQKQP